MSKILTFIMTLSFVLTAASLHANTRYGWGTITSIQFEDNPNGHGKGRYPHFRVLIECGNEIECPEWKEQLVPIHQVGRHGPTVYVLDGKLSTAKEALKVGRMVNVMDNQYMAVSSTVMGPEAVAGKRDPENAIYMVEIGSAQIPYELYDWRSDSWKPVRNPQTKVQLFVDVAGGEVRDAYVVKKTRYLPRTHQEIEKSSLKVTGGRISGEVTVAFNLKGCNVRPAKGQEAIVKTMQVDATVTDAGVIVGGKDKRKIGRLLNRPNAMPQAGQFWMRFTDTPMNRDRGFVVAPLKDGQLEGVTFMYGKGLPLAVLSDNELMIGDDSFSGTSAGNLKVWQTEHPCKITFKGRLFGNRIIIGEYTLTWGDMVIKDHFRGGIVAEGAPPLVNKDKATLAIAKPAIDEWKKNRK